MESPGHTFDRETLLEKALGMGMKVSAEHSTPTSAICVRRLSLIENTQPTSRPFTALAIDWWRHKA